MSAGERVVRIDPVHTMYFIDSFSLAEDYKNARSCQLWVNYAVDRMRFKRRIQLCEEVIKGILDPSHRARVFQSRYASYRE